MAQSSSSYMEDWSNGARNSKYFGLSPAATSYDFEIYSYVANWSDGYYSFFKTKLDHFKNINGFLWASASIGMDGWCMGGFLGST